MEERPGSKNEPWFCAVREIERQRRATTMAWSKLEPIGLQAVETSPTGQVHSRTALVVVTIGVNGGIT
jgi:hypothetical protein